MRVLLTGGSGYIGSRAIAHLLAGGHEVHLLLREVATPGLQRRYPDCQLQRADLLQPEQVAALLARLRPEGLLHLAWYTEHGRFWNAPVNADWQLATLQLALQFARHGGRRLVAAGTCAEYDWRHGRCDEQSTPCTPDSFYGQCKFLTGATLASWMRQAGVSHAWGRLFFLYGEDEAAARLVPSVAARLVRGEVAECSHGLQVRDFMHVEDAAAAFVALLDSSVEGNVNVASGTPTTVRALVEQLAAHFPSAPGVRFAAPHEGPPQAPEVTASVHRLHREVGFQPTHTLASGLAATARWWQDRAATAA